MAKAGFSILKFFFSIMVGLGIAAGTVYLMNGSLDFKDPKEAVYDSVHDEEKITQEEVVKKGEEKEKTERSKKWKREEMDAVPILTLNNLQTIYVGIDNPLTIEIPGVDPENFKVSGYNCNVNGENGKYTLTASTVGEANITVSAPGAESKKYDFRVKKTPSPIPVLGAGPNKKGGAMGRGEFKAQLGMAAILEDFDFKVKCSMQGFELMRVSSAGDRNSVINKGARYGTDAAKLVKKAAPGDLYIFDRVKAKCPGDKAGRKLPSIVFSIK